MGVFQFSGLEGNRTRLSLLQREVLSGHLKNVIILSGPMGVGKSSCAGTLALRLTCENPKGAEPCLTCSTCKMNLRALQESGNSTRISKKNVSLWKDKGDVKSLIDEVFVLKGSEENDVYILEEAHELPHAFQTPLLDEFDRIGENTYIILPTTRPHKLLPELRDRARNYEFTRLSVNEMRKLYDRLVHRNSTDSPIADMFIRYSRGTPRTLVNLIDFVRNAQPSEDELRDFLNYIDNREFVELFKALKGGLRNLSYVLDPLLSRYSAEVLVSQLKEFSVNLVFAVATGEYGDLKSDEFVELTRELTDDQLYRIANSVEKIPPLATDVDVRFAMIRLSRVLQEKSIVSPMVDNSESAAHQSVATKEVFEEEYRLRETNLQNTPAKISIEALRTFKSGEH